MAFLIGKRMERPPYLGGLILATAIYLLVELAFNAHLLDVAGGVSDIHDIEKAEHFGRIISGVAAALAVCGSLVCPALARGGATLGWYITVCACVGTPVVAGVYYGEKALVDSLVARSTAEARQDAALLSVASHQLRRNGIEVRGLDLSDDALKSPEGKAFVALFSPIVFQLPEVGRVIDDQLNTIVRHAVSDQIGGLDGFYDKAYVPSIKQMEGFFGQYADAVERYIKAANAYPKEANKAWSNYVAKLKKHGMTPGTVRPAYHDRVRRDVRKAGVPVPSNWHPSDKATFLVSFRDAYQKRLTSKLNDGMNAAGLAGENLPLTLNSFDKFLAHPVIQKRWKKSLGVPEASRLTNGMSREAFGKAAFNPLVNRVAKENIADLRTDVAHYERGEKLWEKGEEAMRSIVVPPLALGLSIIGAIVHLCKIALYSSRLAIPYSRVWVGSLALFVALAVAPFAQPNAITGTQTYANVEKIIADTGNRTPHAFRWVIQAQACAYPVNNWVRETLFPRLFG